MDEHPSPYGRCGRLENILEPVVTVVGENVTCHLLFCKGRSDPLGLLRILELDHYKGWNCLLSLWRVVRGSKLMHLDLIHGLFIT